ncbi:MULTISPECIES: Sec-independent protein translocase protein TatB [Eikenella]|uniref:Sec-independent protein translocase protein TatB n=1 Tax=Eikenella longinqua TaxID=1795827 RepID=A0A1A9RYD7_9NEIS|nr:MULTISPECIES: Sec-independent protein translocase protein TatB [Eikenella]OAM29996.1 twin arginine-targeting protein translocase TatB [Eikenella longinqua]
MFDFALSEMLLAAVVALVVLGPERLPQAARALGRMLGRIQRLAGSLKAELAQHADVADLRRMQETLAHTASELKQEMQQLRAGAMPDLPAWERLPPPRTPADFGIDTDEDGKHVPRPAPLPAGFHTPSLQQRARAGRRKMQPRVRIRPRLRVRKQAGGGSR